MAIRNMIGWMKRGHLGRWMIDTLHSRRNESFTSSALPAEFLDVRKLIQQLTVEELCQTAEQYFARLTNWDYQLAKPFAEIQEMREVLICFAQLLHGLRLAPGMDVLDFGAGTCWASHYLTQLGCAVTACDVSPSALRIGQELYRRQPVFGDKPAPRFLCFNGRKLDLPDESVERITCLDAFHHVPNQEQVLAELGRVLKPGGIAGFSEPGPTHSHSLGAQHEMRHHRVIENDIVIGDIWKIAQKSGFSQIKLAVFGVTPLLLSLDEFEDYLQDGRTNTTLARSTQSYIKQARRLFFLHKDGQETLDSRQREGLQGALQIELVESRVPEGTPWKLRGTVVNTGTAVWLPSNAHYGPVNLGCHLFKETGEGIDFDYARFPLTPEAPRAIRPGEKVHLKATISSPLRGRYMLEFDLVAEQVCWFGLNDSTTVRIAVEVYKK